MAEKSYSYRRAVLATFHRSGDARLHEVASVMGREWTKPKLRSCLRRMLWTMEREGLVMRPTVGLFRATVGIGCGGMGCESEIIRSIAARLQADGGKMQVSDLLEEFTDRRIWGPGERDEQSRRILRIIGDADCFWQDGESIGLASEHRSALVRPPVALAPIAAPSLIPDASAADTCR